MRRNLAKSTQTIAEIAGRQHGVIALAQLRWAGLTHSGIQRRVRAGHLHRLYRGVFSVGHTDLSREGRWLAAVLACGPGAVLSHASAAVLWKLSPTSPSMIHVTVPSTSGRTKRPGIRLHYSTTLTAKDVTRRHNIPVTTPRPHPRRPRLGQGAHPLGPRAPLPADPPRPWDPNPRGERPDRPL